MNLPTKLVLVLDVRGVWSLIAPTVTFGAETVTNGTFDADTDWSKQTGWSIGSGVASCDGSQSAASNLYQARGISSGPVVFGMTVSDYSTGTVRLASGSAYGDLRSANGAFTEAILANDFGFNINISGNADFAGKVDDVTIKAVSGLSGVDTGRSQHTVTAGLTIADENHWAGVWSDGDDATAPNNYLVAYYDRSIGQVYTAKIVAGAWTVLDNTGATYSAGATLKVVPDGNDRLVYYNDVLIYTATLTDAALINGTCAGLFSTDNNNTFANAQAEA